MIKKRPFPLKKLIMYYQPNKLTMNGGTIDTAIIEDPQLLHFEITFPKDFEFPSDFYELGLPKDDEITLTLSLNHSEKNDIIFTGISSYMYSKIKSSGNLERSLNESEYRFMLLLEQQSIISLVSLFETFISNVVRDLNYNMKFYNDFRSIKKSLKQCGIDIKNLEGMINQKILDRASKILKYVFLLRNLYVHNGGIINEKFHRKFPEELSQDNIGKLIRVSYNDYQIIREWTSFLIQEICRIIGGYDKVWKDYVLSSGILILDSDIVLRSIDKEEIIIPLKDGIKLKGKIADTNAEQIDDEKNNKTDNEIRQFSQKIDIRKLLL